MTSLTVFTPTFNRQDTLKNTYKSLVSQTNKNFEWLIVDDGSTDNTKDLVNKWINDNIINIKYIYKENGGKHTAYNTAIEVVSTDYFFMSLDSDDMLKSDAIEYIHKVLLDNPSCDGLATPWENLNGELPNRDYDVLKLNGMTLKEAFSNNAFNAELSFVFNTSKLKKYKFPILNNEKFFTEAYLYYQMDFKIIWLDKYTKYGIYLNDGYSNDKRIFVKYPCSWYYYNKLRAKENKKIVLKLKYLIYMISFGRMSNSKNIIKNSPYKFLTIMLYPFGVLGEYYLLKK